MTPVRDGAPVPAPRLGPRFSPVAGLLLGFLLGVLLLRPPPVDAQEVTPADSAAVLLDAAREFEAEGRTDLAEALYQHVLDRFPGTPAAADVRRRFAAEEPGRGRVRLEEDGNVELLVWSSVYGGWLGIAVPAMLGADDPESYGLGLLVGAPLGFLGARAYGSDRVITEGHARALTLGGTWGTWQGLGWAQVLEIGSDCYTDGTGRQFCDDNPSAEATFATMVAGGLLGLGVGGWVANRTDVTAGTSTLANVGALWGSGYGVAAGLLADVDDSDTMWALALTGGNLGLASMALLGPEWDVSRGRARLISVAGMVGLLGGLGIDLLLLPDGSQEVATLIPTVTSTAGLVVGTWVTRGMDAEGDARGAGGPATDGALVRWRDGGLELSVPRPGLAIRAPVPAEALRASPAEAGEAVPSRPRDGGYDGPRVDARDGGGSVDQRLRPRVALTLTLFSARF